MAIPLDPITKDRLEKSFLFLKRTQYAILEKPNSKYNCIAWAMGIKNQWWWPKAGMFWPVEPKVVTYESFVKAFKTQGFDSCDNPNPENGLNKIALYMAGDTPKHAARIVTASLWTSKLGVGELIEHEPIGLNSVTYGIHKFYFFRKIK